MRAFLIVALIFAAVSCVFAQEEFASFESGVVVDAANVKNARSAVDADLKTDLTDKQKKENKKAAQALGPAYLAIQQALGARTQAYMSNYIQSLGYAPAVGFFRNLYASAGRAQFIAIVRQFSALYGGASGYQLALFVRQFGSPAAAAQELSAFYKAIGVPLLVFLQQFTVTTGGRASVRPAGLSAAVFKANGEADTIAALEALLAAVGNKPKLLGTLVGRLYNGLNAASLTKLISTQLAGVVSVVEAASTASTVPFFDFSSVSTSVFDVSGAATIMIAAIKLNSYF